MEAPQAAPPGPWLKGFWLASRACWIVLFPLPIGLLLMLAAYGSLRRGLIAQGLRLALFGAFFLSWAAWAARAAWRTHTGEEARGAEAMRVEIQTAAGALALAALGAFIVGPSFSRVLRASAEAGMKGGLAELRMAVERHKQSHEGRAPASLAAVVGGERLPAVPRLWGRFSEGSHPPTTEAVVLSSREPTDSGRWAYVVAPDSPTLDGTVFIDCTHTDFRGSIWTAY